MRSTEQKQLLLTQAVSLLPDLRRARDKVQAAPDAALAGAFPEADPGFESGAARGLESLGPPAAGAVERRRLQRLQDGARAVEKLDSNGQGADLTEAEADGLEAIVLTMGRPAILFKNGKFLDPPPPWEHLGQEGFRGRIETAARSVGRVEVTGHPDPRLNWAGTGFLVGPNLILTNRHVAAVFARAVPGGWRWKPGMGAGLDYLEAPPAGKPAEYGVKEVVGVHWEFDLALLRVEPAPGGAAPPNPLRVHPGPPAAFAEREVCTLGYPAYDPRNDPAVLRDIFADVYDVKRLQPGKLMSFDRQTSLVRHDCSTLGGNSGSCVIDLEAAAVIGLHFRGFANKYNEAVALWTLRDDPLLKEAGVSFV